ncbi:MAG: hypothetical protein J7578_13955 [Chitinophagaceae bacterium]|nr:hypothetical protein [Chitinophagaceae bacterium]
MKKSITIICLFLGFLAEAQDSPPQDLRFSPATQKTPRLRLNEYEIGVNHSFYIYRNCVYRVVASSGSAWLIRVTDIRNDSIYYDHFGEITSYHRDTLFRLHPSEIITISTYENALGQLFNSIDLHNYKFTFEPASNKRSLPVSSATLWSLDSSRSATVELVNFLHGKTVSFIFLKCNKAFYYNENASLDCEDGIAIDGPPPYPANRRDVVWFTPSRAREINGLNIGIQTFGLNRDSVRITGLNLNADILSAIFTVYMPFIRRDSTRNLKNMPDTVSYSEAVDKIYGVSLSGGGLLGPGLVRGASINGLWCMLTVMDGVCITGLYNRIEQFRGLAIASFGNSSIKGTGLQIGLVNKCKHLKGVQIGLWNENSKRKLPLINWNFN